MAIELATFLQGLDALAPLTGDQVAEGDDHIRMLKAVLKTTFPGRGGEDMRTVSKVANYMPGVAEVGVVFVHAGALSVTLPVSGGIPTGSHYFFKAQTGGTTLLPGAGDTVNGAVSLLLAASEWALVVKNGTNWVVLKGQEVSVAYAANAGSAAAAPNHLPLVGGTLSGDLTLARGASPVVGTLILGNTGKFLQFDGGSYQMPGADLVVNGRNISGAIHGGIATNTVTVDPYGRVTGAANYGYCSYCSYCSYCTYCTGGSFCSYCSYCTYCEGATVCSTN